MMEIYLNIAEWGPNGEFGAEAAARRAFKKSARDLTNAEAALLVATLPNPIVRDAAKPGPRLRQTAAKRQAGAGRAGAAAAACVLSKR
jgi:monofunctional biosynthetic peptidoglycan transglycosylase